MNYETCLRQLLLFSQLYTAKTEARHHGTFMQIFTELSTPLKAQVWRCVLSLGYSVQSAIPQYEHQRCTDRLTQQQTIFFSYSASFRGGGERQMQVQTTGVNRSASYLVICTCIAFLPAETTGTQRNMGQKSLSEHQRS